MCCLVLKRMITTAWLFSRETQSAHPELAWLNRTLDENSALITDLGPAAPDSGLLVGSAVRRRLYASGDFKPTLGLGI